MIGAARLVVSRTNARRDSQGGRPELRRPTEGAGVGIAPARRDKPCARLLQGTASESWGKIGGVAGAVASLAQTAIPADSMQRRPATGPFLEEEPNA